MMVAVLLLLLALAALCAAGWLYIQKLKAEKEREERAHRKGAAGEAALRSVLEETPGYWRLLTNLYVPKAQKLLDFSPAETTEVDAVLVHETGIYVFEMKNYSGWIFGRRTDEQWTQTIKTGDGRISKTQFRNPIRQNEAHVYWLSRYLGIDEGYMRNFVVFGRNCLLRSVSWDWSSESVAVLNNLAETLGRDLRRRGSMLSYEQVNAVYEKLLPTTQVSSIVKRRHNETVQRNRQREKQKNGTWW